MSTDQSPKTLSEHFAASWRRNKVYRPVSAWLLLAIFVSTLLGGQLIYVLEDPKRFALFLTLYFAFFFMVLYRALLDCFDIARENLRARQQLFRTTLGDADFTAELGQRLAQHRNRS